MRAVILAAGKGTRLGALTQETPKPMIEVAGRPVIEHIMLRIMSAGIKDFVLITRYLSEKIENYLGDGSRYGASIKYVRQPDRHYGTGAALLAAKELAHDAPLIMTFGDVITSAENYSGAAGIFNDNECAGTITLNWVDDPYKGAAVMMDDTGKVTRIIEKPPKGSAPSNWNSAGIFVFKPIVFDYLENLTPSDRGEYELPQAMNRMVEDGLAIYPCYLQGIWRDVGTVEDIAITESILKQENWQFKP